MINFLICHTMAICISPAFTTFSDPDTEREKFVCLPISKKITLNRIAVQLRKLLLLFSSRTKSYYKTNAEDFSCSDFGYHVWNAKC